MGVTLLFVFEDKSNSLSDMVNLISEYIAD